MIMIIVGFLFLTANRTMCSSLIPTTRSSGEGEAASALGPGGGVPLDRTAGGVVVRLVHVVVYSRDELYIGLDSFAHKRLVFYLLVLN